MTEFNFVEEIPSRGGGTKAPDPVYVELAEALRARPGVWAVWPKPLKARTKLAMASGINSCRAPAPTTFRTGEFESCTRSEVMYVRFVGAS